MERYTNFDSVIACFMLALIYELSGDRFNMRYQIDQMKLEFNTVHRALYGCAPLDNNGSYWPYDIGL